MKKILYTFLSLSFLYLVSCSDVTDLQQKGALDSNTIYADSAHIELAVVGMYNAAQSQYAGYNGGGDQRGYPFGAAHIEQGEMRGEDLVNTQQFFLVVYANNQTTSSPNVVNFWSSLYELINEANSVIAGVESARKKNLISESTANAYIGEARFLRAMAYHELLIFWSRPYNDNPDGMGVPYRDFPSQDDIAKASSQGRNTIAECYNAIVADLDFAEANLPVANPTNKVTRASKGAAIALKTRIYLHMNNWDKVIEEAKKLAPSSSAPSSPIGGYTLTASPDGAFTNNKSAESIFSIEYASNDQASGNGGLGSMFSPEGKGGRGLISVSPNLFNASFWVADDKRRTLFVEPDSTLEDPIYFVTKYKDPVTNTDYAPIIRYAEVILNYAEAEARKNGVTSTALELLNSVRNRAVTDPAEQYSAADFADGKELVQAILNERRIEFIGEGRRFPDIHRLAVDANFTTGGIPEKLLPSDFTAEDYDAASDKHIDGAIKPVPYSNFKFLYPISNVEIANNPVLKAQQNPGY
jgi:hypothetical protein